MEELRCSATQSDEEMKSSRRFALLSIFISVFCLATMAIMIPLLDSRLEAAQSRMQQRMDAFKVGQVLMAQFLNSRNAIRPYSNINVLSYYFRILV